MRFITHKLFPYIDLAGRAITVTAATDPGTRRYRPANVCLAGALTLLVNQVTLRPWGWIANDWASSLAAYLVDT